MKNKLEKALKEGTLTQEQFDALEALENTQKNDVAKDEEPFNLVGGFGEILITIGVILSLVAISKLFGSLVLFVVSFVLSWYFVKVRRLTLPGIILLLIMSWVAMGYISSALQSASMHDSLTLSSLFVVGMLVYYVVFRLPFALYILAWSIASLLLTLLSYYYDDSNMFFMSDLSWLPLVVSFILGLVALVVGVYYDMQDPKRNKVQTQNAFWLHLFAAPLLLWPWVARFFFLQTSESAVIALVGIALFAIIGLLLDRRSFVTFGIVSLGILLAYFFRETLVDGNVLLLSIGAYVLVLGTFWSSIRKFVLKRIPNYAWKRKLPA